MSAFSVRARSGARALAAPLARAISRSLDLRLVRDFALLSGGELFSKLIGFAAFAYLARTLDPASYGAVELAISLSVFFALIVEGGLAPVGAREVAQDAGRARAIAGQIPSARFALVALAIPAMCGVVVLLGQPREFFWLACLFSVGLLAVPFRQHWLFQGLEMMEWVSLAQVLKMSAFALGVFLLVHSPDDLLRVGFVEVAAAFTLAAYFFVAQGRQVTPFRPSADVAGVTRLLREGFAIGMSRIIWVANQYLPVVLIALVMGSVEVAFFAAAHRIVMSLLTFSFLYHFNLFTAVTRALAVPGQAYEDLVGPSFKATAWGGIGLALVLTLVADDLCVLVFGDAFRTAGPALAVLVWTIPVQFLSGHARFALIARREQQGLLVAQAAGVLITVVIGGFAIALFGVVGASVTMLVSSLVVWFVAHAYASSRVAPLPFLADVARPVLTALAVALACGELSGPAWTTALVAGFAFALLGPILDRTLVADLRKLAAAKEGFAPGSVSAIGVEAVG